MKSHRKKLRFGRFRKRDFFFDLRIQLKFVRAKNFFYLNVTATLISVREFRELFVYTCDVTNGQHWSDGSRTRVIIGEKNASKALDRPGKKFKGIPAKMSSEQNFTGSKTSSLIVANTCVVRHLLSDFTVHIFHQQYNIFRCLIRNVF